MKVNEALKMKEQQVVGSAKVEESKESKAEKTGLTMEQVLPAQDVIAEVVSSIEAARVTVESEKEEVKREERAEDVDVISAKLAGDIEVIIPDVISCEKPVDLFECNAELKEYVKARMGEKVFLKMWPTLNSNGEICIYLRYKGVGAKDSVLKQIRRERILGNKTCLNFLKNYKKIDITILKALYKILDALSDKLDDVEDAEVEEKTFVETYKDVIVYVEDALNRLNTEKNNNLMIKMNIIEGETYICIKGGKKLERILSEIGAPFKKMEFLRELKYAEGVKKPLLKVQDGRGFDNRETGDTEHWYYIRKDTQLIEKV